MLDQFAVPVVCEFADVVSHPPSTAIVIAAHEGSLARADVIVAIGGGSSVHTAKGISLLLILQLRLF